MTRVHQALLTMLHRELSKPPTTPWDWWYLDPPCNANVMKREEIQRLDEYD